MCFSPHVENFHQVLSWYDLPLPSYSVFLVRYESLWSCLWPFDLGQWPYMADYVINLSIGSSKFEDPTAIRSWVMSSDISHKIPWQCVCSHCACVVSRDLCVGGKFFSHIWNPWSRFAYSLLNFYGATMTFEGLLQGACPIFNQFLAKTSKYRWNPAQNGGFGEKGV